MAARRLSKSSTWELRLSERRFYPKCLLLRAVMSVATEQTMSFLASDLNKSSKSKFIIIP